MTQGSLNSLQASILLRKKKSISFCKKKRTNKGKAIEKISGKCVKHFYIELEIQNKQKKRKINSG